MKRILLSIVFLLMFCAPAWATDVTLSSFQPSFTWRYGSPVTLRVYVSTQFLTSDGVVVQASPVGGSNFYKTITCTVADGVVTVPSFTLPSTDDARPNSARYTLIFYAGATKRDTLFSNYRWPIAYGATMTIAQLVTWNTTAPAPPRPGFPDTVQVQTLINAVLPVADASDVIKGRAKLSVAPVSATNPIAQAANDPSVTSNSFDVTKAPFYAIPDDGVDDTAAFQAALNLFAYNGTLRGGRIWVPSGVYNITGLVYRGDFGHSFVMQGSAAGAGFNGAVLKYTGATGGTAIQLLGANYCRLVDIAIDGGAAGGVGGALVGLSVDYDSSRSQSSFNCFFDRVVVGGVNGTNSKGIAVGLLSSTSAEHEFTDCNVIGHFTAGTTYYGFWIGNGNSKNIRLRGGGVNSCRWGLSAGNSGYVSWQGVSFASNTQGDFYGSGSNITITGGGSEGSGRFIDSAISPSVVGQISVMGFYWYGNCVSSDDYIVKWPGAFTTINSQYGNGRTGTSIPKFQVEPISATGGGGIVSLNNTYQDNGSTFTTLPFYNSSNTLFSELGTGPLGLTSRGDRVSLVSTGGATRLLPAIDPDVNLSNLVRNITAAGANSPFTEDVVITMDATLGDNYIEMINASSYGVGKRFIVIKKDNSANIVTLYSPSANINGADRIVLTNQWDFAEIISNGTVWYAIRSRIGELAGQLTIGGGGTVAYTWKNVFAVAPICVASDTNATPAAVSASSTTTVLTLTGTVGHVVNYICQNRD